jgi:hypothetical protein
MLSAEQVRHFAEKGWVVREGVFSAAECAAMRAAGERQLRRLRDAEVGLYPIVTSQTNVHLNHFAPDLLSFPAAVFLN